MNMQLLQNIGKKFMKKVPVLKPGATVRVHQKIKEGGKERVQVFEGLIIKVNAGNGPSKTFTVRKIVGGIGVEKIFPLYSKNITKIQVTKSSDVRRSKLYYMRKRSGKSARLREKHLTEKDVLMEEIEGVEEEVKPDDAEASAQAEETTDQTEDTAENATDKEKPAVESEETSEPVAEKDEKAAQPKEEPKKEEEK